MPKTIKVVDVHASASEPLESSVVVVEADPNLEIPNEERLVPVVVEETSPPTETAELEATAEPVDIAEPKKKRAPRARSVKPKKREPVEVVEEETTQSAEPVEEIV